MSTPTDLSKVVELLASLIAFDTTSRNANRACIDFIRDYLDTHGIASDIIPGQSEGKACLWATIGQGQNGIALAGHTDVVPTDGQNWLSDPFSLTERDDKLYGRGAADMKGFIACALAFIPEFLAANTGTCFHLALTCDEETDMTGAMRLTDALAARHVKPAWFWVGEPTGLTIVDQHKGVSAYRTSITGISGHSGKPDKGLNAIELAVTYMNIITEAAQRRKAAPFPNSAFDPPYTTVNLAVINGGTAENIIAGQCEFLWQLRAHPGETAQSLREEIESRANAALAPRLQAFAPQAHIETCACFDIPPFKNTHDATGVNTLKKHLKCDDTQTVSFATEAGIYQKLGTSAVICGPGSIDQAHQPNEYIDKNQLSSCVDLMRLVLLSSPPRDKAD